MLDSIQLVFALLVLLDICLTQLELDAILILLVTPTVHALSALMDIFCRTINVKVAYLVLIAKLVILDPEALVFSATVDSTLMLIKYARDAQLTASSVIPQLFAPLLVVDTI